MAIKTLVAQHGQLPAPGLSKHNLILCTYKSKSSKHSAQLKKSRSYMNIDIHSLLLDSRSLPLHDILHVNSADAMVKHFNSLLNNFSGKRAATIIFFKKHVPGQMIISVNYNTKETNLSVRQSKPNYPMTGLRTRGFVIKLSKTFAIQNIDFITDFPSNKTINYCGPK